jgi:transposase
MARYFTRTEGAKISHNFVADVWRECGLQPWRQSTFKLSKDPQFEEKLTDIVGLYLNPPSGAVVLSLDEKTQVQALDRTQPALPLDFGKTAKRTHDYVRHGITDLFAALNVETGHITATCRPEHKAPDFLHFMDMVCAEYGDKKLHVILDNASTHTSGDAEKWLKNHPNVTFHFTPKGGSWINQIETWFGILTRQSLRRSTHASVAQLTRSIRQYVKDWNVDCKPFKWIASADEILAKVRWVEAEVRRMTGAREVSTITGH